MATHFVTRHCGAREWARSRGLPVDYWVTQLDVSAVEAGDIVIGTLPVQLAADVNSCGARYLHLSLDLPATLRGTELSAEQMNQVGARLEEYRVVRLQRGLDGAG